MMALRQWKSSCAVSGLRRGSLTGSYLCRCLTALYLDGYRLPATYANFLIINGAVLMPGTCSEKDGIARQRLQEAFPDRKVIVIDCRALLSGHGSLHCITMQFPDGYLKTEKIQDSF